MKGTGVHATEEEIEQLKTSVRVSGCFLSGGTPMSSPQKECHRMALAHGLPEITGFYGLSMDGEFVRMGVE